MFVMVSERALSRAIVMESMKQTNPEHKRGLFWWSHLSLCARKQRLGLSVTGTY